MQRFFADQRGMLKWPNSKYAGPPLCPLAPFFPEIAGPVVLPALIPVLLQPHDLNTEM